MAKWFDETILIKYWEDRCHNYKLQDERRIISAKRNPSLGRYPDIGENYLSDNSVVPAEIEWLTTNFDEHGHDINELRNNNGFLIVYEQNAGFPVEQVQLDKQDIINWFKESAEEICIETLQNIEKTIKKRREPQIYLFYVPKSGEQNFQIAIENGIWGFPGGDEKITRGLEKIMQMKKGDIFVFVKEWKAEDKGVRGRPPKDKYVGTYKEIVGVTLTKGFYKDDKKIWENDTYPYRVDFRKEILFRGKDIPCNKKVLGESLHEILRKLQVNGTIERIDSSLIVKLMSLCTK